MSACNAGRLAKYPPAGSARGPRRKRREEMYAPQARSPSVVHARAATAEEAALRVAPSPEGQVAASEDGQGTGRAVLKEEQVVPPMPPGAFVKEEQVATPMLPDAIVKREHKVLPH